jgi:hypothetical protein
MKKNLLMLFAFALSFFACQHEPILIDTEYLNQAAIAKKHEYANTNPLGGDNGFSISLLLDSAGQDKLNLGYHVSHNHTLDAVKINQSNWLPIREHYGYNIMTNAQPSNKDQIVSFQIRSKTPQNEIMSGEVVVPKLMSVTVTDLGNNTFKITWAAQNQKQRVLMSLEPTFTYISPYFSGNFAVETEDDGEYIIQPSVFDKFDKTSNASNAPYPTQMMQIRLLRKVANRTIVKQASTGIEYAVYGGYEDAIYIDVTK